MNPEKIGNFIKELRKKNNLTQQDLADKYNVTYQAVSKWENAKNLPDISLIRQMSKDFNVSIDDILDGEVSNNKKANVLFIVFVSLIIMVLILLLIIKHLEPKNNFEFKTISTSCEKFNVSGSIAYDKEKSSIYISNINYCGGDDNTVYKAIECNLYETDNNTSTKISSCSTSDNTTLEEYLKDVKLNIDNYTQACKKYTDDSLYLEINATDSSDKIVTYKIPLNLNNNCPK